jgi:putative ABC transport system ATP-binding protein
MNQTPLIDIRNVTKDFPLAGGKVSVLKGVSLQAMRGEFLAIVGPSGNGKSTLLNMITGIDHPTSGEVYVNGTPIHAMNEEQLSVWRGTQVGIVFQFFQLLPSLNLLQNIILPMDFANSLPKKQRKERAMHLLELVGLADQAQKLPGNVSGGQQQRAAIARALANDPPLIVADEPTGNLDAQTSDDVFNLFSHLVDQGKTLVMVTHNDELACQTPRRVVVRNGLIAHDGPCEG